MSRILKIEKTVDKQLIELLKKNTVGTPGKSLVYQHVNVEEKLRNLQDPYFIKLYLRDTLAGTMCLSRRKLKNGKSVETGYYIRYFTFKEQFRSKNYDRTVKKKASSVIRKEIHSLLEGNELPEKDPYFFYAYFDPGNIRSGRIITEFGFQKVSSFTVLIFNRLFPQPDPRMNVCATRDTDKILDRLDEFYREEQLVSFENLFIKGNYFEIREKSEVICSVQAIPDRWNVLELPGSTGRLLLNVFSRIPYLKRLINRDFRFILLEGLFFKNGREKDLEKLFSSILGFYKLNTCILCIDPRSKIYRSIKRLDLGIVNKFIDNISMDVVIRNVNTHSVHPDKPVYISGFDVL